MKYWLAVGSPDNWAFCLNNRNIWGVSVRYLNVWQFLTEGDIVLCYATSPVKGLIGYCTVQSKQKGSHPLFPAERKGREVLYPLRMALIPRKVIPHKKWEASCVAIERGRLVLPLALQEVPAQRASSLVAELEGVQ